MQKIFQSSLSARSRTLIRAASVLFVASTATGCVASKHYDEARAVAESETHAHARTRERLEASLARISTLEADLAAREQAMEKNASLAEESKLESTVAGKEKDAAFQLVEQLRSELARTGEHLVLFASEKRDLTQTLLIAEERMRDIESAGKNIAELVAATRDLSLALPGELDKQVVGLGARDGQVVLSMSSDHLFAANGESLVVESGPVLAAIGKVSEKHPTLRVVVREPHGAPLSSARLTRLAEALRQSGVADTRLVMPAPSNAAMAPVPVALEKPAVPPAQGAPDGANAPAELAAPAPAVPAAAAAPVDPATLRYEIAFAP